jgi:hypothetical protein
LKPEDCTIVVAIDAQYVHKLWWSYQTWRRMKPEMAKMPLLIIADGSKNGSPVILDHALYNFVRMAEGFGHPSIDVVAWDVPWDATYDYATQRERMLNALVFGPALYVKTPWYLKLDADTYATDKKLWLDEGWFAPVDGVEPVFVASPWGYTKPGDTLDILDDWGDTVEGLKHLPRLNVPHEPGSDRVRSPRMASWVMFGQTNWLQEVVKLCPDQRLPVPSQDTFLYYAAARRKDYYYRVRMAFAGWGHVSRQHKLEAECRRLLGNTVIEMPEV